MSDNAITLQKKTAKIAQILGLMEESNRGKAWILHHVEKYGQKFHVQSTMNVYEMLNCCSPGFVDYLLDILKGNDIVIPDETEMKTFYWFFSDIVAGSNPSIPTKSQVEKITTLNNLILQTETFKKRDPKSTIILPTGDGQAIGFSDNAANPLLLAIELDKALKQYNKSKRGKEKLLLRIGIESGPVYFVKDLEGKDNVWGPGIILTRHVMDICGDTQIFAGNRIADMLRQSARFTDMLHPVGNFETKYGENVTLYNVYGEGFGNKSAPAKPKKAVTNSHRSVKSSSNFTFNSIEVNLEINNTKTMQTHHSWIWDLTNISKEPRSKIFYYLDGQVPKSFPELHIKVTDKNKKRLEIGEIAVDKPYRKEFYVMLPTPVLHKQSIHLKLEYDWEEPDRMFSYKFFSGAKKFQYACIVPKDLDLKNRVLKIDTGTGYRVHATPPSTLKHLEDKTVINWTKNGLNPQDSYEFYW